MICLNCGTEIGYVRIARHSSSKRLVGIKSEKKEWVCRKCGIVSELELQEVNKNGSTGTEEEM